MREKRIGKKGTFMARLWDGLPEHMQRPAPLLDVLRVFGDPATPEYHGIFAQLIAEIGSRVHSELLRLGRDGGSSGSVSMRRVDIGDSLYDRCDMDRKLVQYVMGCQSKTRGKQYWTACSDKSAVGGFSLQATLFAFGDNLAVLAPPAVPGGGGGGERAGRARNLPRQRPGRASVRCIRTSWGAPARTLCVSGMHRCCCSALF